MADYGPGNPYIVERCQDAERPVELLVIRNGCTREIAEQLLEQLEDQLAAMRIAWGSPGKQREPWADKQLLDLRKARDWMREYHEKHWGHLGV